MCCLKWNLFPKVDHRPFTVEVMDSVADYVAYMKEIFDFAAIKNLLHGANGQPLKILINAMHGGKHFIFLPQIWYIHPLKQLRNEIWQLRYEVLKNTVNASIIQGIPTTWTMDVFRQLIPPLKVKNLKRNVKIFNANFNHPCTICHYTAPSPFLSGSHAVICRFFWFLVLARVWV